MKKIIFSLSFISILALAQSYIKGNILYETPTVTTASNGTTALLVTSQPNQVLDGATTHTHSLPNVQTPTPDIATGFTFKFKNRSSGNWTITYQDASTAFTLKPLESAEAVLTSNATANGTWAIKYIEYVRVTGDTMTGGLGLNYTGVTANTAIIVDASRKLVSSAVTSTELGYLSGLTTSLSPNINGLTANVQTQLNAKVNRAADTMTGNLGLDYALVTPDRAAYVDSNRVLRTSTAVSSQELEYLDGATANLQTQINNMSGVTGNFLPISGGTLTGNLRGVSVTVTGQYVSTFNASSTGNGNFVCNPATNTSACGMTLNNGGSGTGFFFIEGNTAASLLTGVSANALVYGSSGTRVVQEAVNNSIFRTVETNGIQNNGKPMRWNGSTSGAFTLAPAATTTSYTAVMPSAQGATTSVMVNDGGGTLSWLAGVVLDATIGVKVVGAEVAQTAASTCSVTRGYGVSVNCNTAGNVNVDFTNAFSESPWCVTGLSENVNDVSCRGNTPSTSGFTTTCTNAAGTGQNRSRSFVCFGKR